jgi:hypothetical protein
MANENVDLATPIILAVALLLTVSTRAHAYLKDITQAEMDFATATVLGERRVEILCRFTPLEVAKKPQPMVLHEL